MTSTWLDQFLVAGLSWLRTMLGLVTRPYETYRRILDRGRGVELFYIAFLGALYFGVASVVKEASFRPFLLTRQFVVLSATAGASSLIVATTIFVAGSIVGGKGKFSRFLLAWGYTMVPTIVWFLATSILYVLIPPPRTTRGLGVLFSIVYLVFSATLFFWKILLGYLSLRFGLRLDLGKIVLVAVGCAPLFALYSFVMYRLGVFKVPFL